MNKKYKNVTISLPVETAQLTRVEAARAGVSTSAYIAALLTERIQQAGQYQAAMNSFADREPYLKSGGTKYPTRDELYED